MKGTSNICHCWMLHPASKIDPDELNFFENYFRAKQEMPSFPFVIFCDHIPDIHELENTLFTNDALHTTVKPNILVAKTKDSNDFPECWRLLSTGIDDVIEWADKDEIVRYLESKYARNNIIHKTAESSLVTDSLVGDSLTWRTFLHDLIETTLFSQASILLIGESGTGKELIAGLIHALDKRPDKKKLIIVDCTTIVPELSGSELFGHERGSYTSAVQSRDGAFALANGGTLFLDEIGELPINLQAELLRVLQEGTYKKVGSNTWQKSNFRLVCATHRNLQAAVEKGRFRQDLFFRISDCQFQVPSLEERRDDIPLLVNHFLGKFFDGKNCPELDRPVMDYLIKRKYPGNIRELRQLVQRLVLKHVEHRKITIGEVPSDDRVLLSEAKNCDVPNNGIGAFIRKALLTGENWWNLKTRISETAIQIALELDNNNKQKAAERLGVDVRTIQQYVKRKMK